MRITFTQQAMNYLEGRTKEVTVESFVVAGCCTPDLPPEVKSGPPRVVQGFEQHRVEGITVYYDSLLQSPAELTIELKDYGVRQELVVKDWQTPRYAR